MFTEIHSGNGLSVALNSLRIDHFSEFPVENPIQIIQHYSVSSSMYLSPPLSMSDSAEISHHERLAAENAQLRARVMDLTAAVNRLKEASDMYRIVADTATDAILCIDEENEIIYANPSCQELLGHCPASLIGRPLTSLIPEHLQAAHETGFQRFIQTGVKSISWSGVELEVLHADGSIIPVDVSIGSLQAPGGQYRFTGFLRDARPRKRFEEESRVRMATLTHAERLKSAGELAAGLAHELNQPLSAVCLHADLAHQLFDKPDQNDLVKNSLEVILLQSERASGILNTLRELIRKSEPIQLKFSVNDAVLAVTQLIRAELQSHEITLDLQLTSEDPVILGDRIQIEQVVLNLLKNAMESIHECDSATRRIAVRTHCDASMLILDVIDTGPGITDPVEAIFQNFVSSKPNGLGIGLGICQSIANRHHGRITATNNCQGGATFSLHVPRQQDTGENS